MVVYEGSYIGRPANQPGSSELNVIFCFFSDCSTTGSGGAILSSASNSVLISESVFYNCNSSGYGGGFHVYDHVNALVTKNCGYKCSSSSCGQFFRCCQINSVFGYNNITLCSALLCPTSQMGAETMIFAYGKIHSNCINSTDNVVSSSWSGVAPHCTSYSYDISEYIIVRTCGTGIYRQMGPVTRCCRIALVNNTATSSRELIYVDGESSLQDCITRGNNCAILFNVCSPRILTLTNCIFDLSISVEATTSNCQFGIPNAQTSFISNLHTAYCDALVLPSSPFTQIIVHSFSPYFLLTYILLQ